MALAAVAGLIHSGHGASFVPHADYPSDPACRPHIYELDGSCWVGLSETKRAAINQSSDVLASVTSGRAAAFGFTYIDARNTFRGHEICASGARWINSVTCPVDESYHPNATGQRGGYYNAREPVA